MAVLSLRSNGYVAVTRACMSRARALELSDRHVVLPILPPYKRLAESLDMREYYTSLGGQPVDHTWSSSRSVCLPIDPTHACVDCALGLTFGLCVATHGRKANALHCMVSLEG